LRKCLSTEKSAFLGKYPGTGFLCKMDVFCCCCFVVVVVAVVVVVVVIVVLCVCFFMTGHLFCTPVPFVFCKQGKGWFKPLGNPDISQGVKGHFAPGKWRKWGTKQQR